MQRRRVAARRDRERARRHNEALRIAAGHGARRACSWKVMLALGCMPNTSGASLSGQASTALRYDAKSPSAGAKYLRAPRSRHAALGGQHASARFHYGRCGLQNRPDAVLPATESAQMTPGGGTHVLDGVKAWESSMMAVV